MKRLMLCLVSLLWISVAQASQPVSHVVMLWFKEGTAAEDIAAAGQQAEMLKQIAGVIGVRQGPAMASDRSHVDDSFDLGLLISFESEAAMRAYVSDPIHKEYVKRYISGRVEKLLVYDF
ncbi:hypothetical protein R50073_39670 [Maricurvus nonylphenolicus]|uniref:Dabb family protein n=1 Tax=Maricurvus nonylphenolicus TaxID=1008307 RepID=UPI0036F1E78E